MITMTPQQALDWIQQARDERDEARAEAVRLREALELAEATINRLHRHAPGSAQGTLDVIRAALGEQKGEQPSGRS